MKARKGGSVNRTDRLNEEFKKEIYEIITRKLKNPLVTQMVSIMRVETAKDLSHAKVFISVFGTDKAKCVETFKAIEQDSKKIRYELAQVMRIRTVPELRFIYDDSIEYGAKMNALINRANENK